MSQKKKSNGNFMQHEGTETGYFSKRKAKFDDEIAKGIGVDKPLPKRKPAPKPKSKKED